MKSEALSEAENYYRKVKSLDEEGSYLEFYAPVLIVE